MKGKCSASFRLLISLSPILVLLFLSETPSKCKRGRVARSSQTRVYFTPSYGLSSVLPPLLPFSACLICLQRPISAQSLRKILRREKLNCEARQLAITTMTETQILEFI